jgi:hypothetical protein
MNVEQGSIGVKDISRIGHFAIPSYWAHDARVALQQSSVIHHALAVPEHAQLLPDPAAGRKDRAIG